MMKKTTKQVIFFVLMLVLFYLSVRMANYWSKKMPRMNTQIAYILVAMCFVAVMLGLYYLSDLDKCSEGFWDVSPAAKCKGVNWYMAQGDSPEAEQCRELLATQKGRCAIASYTCPNGFEGVPKIPFDYTQLSNDNWQNDRCKPSVEKPCDAKADERGRYTSFIQSAVF